jgi:glycosyltransferase involved in cell wall biosynthesis
MVLQGTYPTDIRVEKEANALLDAGHEVSLLCRSVSSPTDTGAKPKEVVEGITVHRINDWSPFPQLLWQQINFDLRFRKPIWENALESIVTTERIDAIHVHDLPPVKSALVVGEKHDIPVIADFHEMYPAAMKHWRSSWSLERKIKQNTVLKPIWRFERLQKQCIEKLDHIITISEEAEQHYISNYDVNPSDITVVGNMVDLDSFEIESTKPVLSEFKEDFLITYVGGFGPHRGIEVAIQSLPKILESVPNARVVLVGKGTDSEYNRKLKNIAEEQGVSDRVTFTGWVDFADVPSYMKASDVCFVLHTQSDHTDVAVPHKLSQYMATGNPLVVTERPPLKRIVSDASCGIVIPYTTAAFADAIIELANDDDKRERFGRNARDAAIDRYNWSTQIDFLTDIYSF